MKCQVLGASLFKLINYTNHENIVKGSVLKWIIKCPWPSPAESISHPDIPHASSESDVHNAPKLYWSVFLSTFTMITWQLGWTFPAAFPDCSNCRCSTCILRQKLDVHNIFLGFLLFFLSFLFLCHFYRFFQHMFTNFSVHNVFFFIAHMKHFSNNAF